MSKPSAVAVLDALPWAAADWEAQQQRAERAPVVARSPLEWAREIREAEEAAFVALYGVASGCTNDDNNGTI